MPLKGYLLTEPGTEGNDNLRAKWINADKPYRFAVPYTFVPACVRAKKVLRQIFIHRGRSKRFYIHDSVEERAKREKAADRILVSVMS